jgi:hypothetical protein
LVRAICRRRWGVTSANACLSLSLSDIKMWRHDVGVKVQGAAEWRQRGNVTLSFRAIAQSYGVRSVPTHNQG